MLKCNERVGNSFDAIVTKIELGQRANVSKVAGDPVNIVIAQLSSSDPSSLTFLATTIVFKQEFGKLQIVFHLPWKCLNVIA